MTASASLETALPDPATRRLITISVMAATLMTSLDATIANVALPHIAGSISASQEEITWVLTSFIVASAVAIPLTGWLANRFGRKRLMLVSVLGFTAASALCGFATSLGQLVGFRILQGVCGAALVPMSQAILLDVNPPSRHGQAMAIWGMGAIIGPIIGPVLGGFLTDNFSWRWIFYINVPVGALTFFGLSTFLGDRRVGQRGRFDLFGFAMLALAVGMLQLMLDRGQQQDWFSSTEICVECGLSVFFFFAFLVQTLTAAHPFVDIALFRDRNFVFACVFGFFVGVLLFSVLALLPSMLQQLLGYPVETTGLTMMPRGLGSLISMIAVGALVKRVDPRVLVIVGLGTVAFSMYLMSGFSLTMDARLIEVSGFVSGLGNGILFVPLSAVGFATLSSRLRNEGAAMFTLIRNTGSAVGISVVQAMTLRDAATIHSRLTEHVRPDNPMLDLRMPDFDFGVTSAIAGLNGELTRQAAMLSYVDSFSLMFVAIAVMAPFVLFMRVPRAGAAAPQLHAE